MPDWHDPRTLRVLMTADAVGGIFSYVLELSRELCGRGVTVLIACMGPPPTAAHWRAASEVAGLQLVHADYALEWADDSAADVDRAGDWLLQLARSFRPDLVHVNGYAHASLPWAVPVLVVAHSCVLSWWRAVLDEDAPDKYTSYRERVKRGLSAAGAVVAPSASMLRALRACYDYRGTGSVIANGISATDYEPRSKRPFFLAAGRIADPAKNLDLLELAAANLPWPVVVAGDDRGIPEPRAVRRLGGVSSPELARWMGEASVFLHPARYEPFGLAPLEAALSGAALVLGRIDSLQEIWGSAASYVSVDDPDELVRTGTQLARNPFLLHTLSARARARGREYSAERMGTAYVERYHELLNRTNDSAERGSVQLGSLERNDVRTAPP